MKNPGSPALPGYSAISAIAFDGSRRVARGDLAQVALQLRALGHQDPGLPILVFHAETGEAIELDLRGTETEVLERLSEDPARPSLPQGERGPGRPRLGVRPREISLLPRHWEWLARQRGGASASLRRLVEAAQKADDGSTTVRAARESLYRFMSPMAGDLPGFEEAARALFAGRREDFLARIGPWPPDVREHLRELAARALPQPPSEDSGAA